MCIAVSGLVVALDADGRTAEIDFQGNRVRAAVGLVKVAPGDRVLVHAGCVLQKLSESDSEALASLYADMEELL